MANTAVIRPARTGFRAFVERHDALFTTLGALVVFLGFYTKEVVLDKANGLDSTLKYARSNYQLNQKLQSINAQLVPMQTSLSEFAVYGSNSTPIHDIYGQIGRNSQLYYALQDDLSLTGQLLDSLPFKSGNLLDTAAHLDARIPSLTKADREVSDLRDQVIHEDTKSIKEIRDRKSYKDLTDAAGVFAGLVDGFGKDVTKFKNDVDAEGSAQLKKLDERASKADGWSKALFVFGWILGLGGKLSKLPALGGGGGGD